MDKALLKQALTKFSAGVVLIAALLFLSAGTMRFWNAWLFMALLFLPMCAAGFVLLRRDPELLRKRLSAKEQQADQRGVLLLGALMFLAGFLLAGLDYRFGWSQLPRIAVYAAGAVFLCAYALYAEVLRENAWLSRTVEVQQGQQVVDTGLYGIVRHPMYSATVLLFLSMPLVLGSLVSLLVFLPYPLLIAKRIKGEEQLLTQELAGYAAYCAKIRWRLIPYVW